MGQKLKGIFKFKLKRKTILKEINLSKKKKIYLIGCSQ